MNLGIKKNIIFVSVSSDLYGASKALLVLVLQIKNKSKEFNPIVCIPYEEGPLKDRLKLEQIEIIEMPVLLLTRSMLKSLSFWNFFSEYKMAKKILQTKLKGRDILWVQSNTLATLFGSFYCFRNKAFHIFHVHEIIDRPWFVKYFFSFLQLIYADKIIFNSFATETFYTNVLKKLKNKSVMIFNGVDRDSEAISNYYRNDLRLDFYNANKNMFLIGLIGRFNRLKGHKLLLEAFKEVNSIHPKTKLCFIGSPPEGQENFLDDIKYKIEIENLSSKVTILPFQNDIYKFIDTLDAIIVPSIEPESFGIIAVEAMLSKRIVIASNLGGLSNIIKHKETGILFEVNKKIELTKSIINVIENPDIKSVIEQNAYKKAIVEFSVATMTNKFLSIYNSI